MCEIMARLVCRNSTLKSDDYRVRNNTLRNQLCDMCDMYQVEDVKHVILHCPYHEQERNELMENISLICPQIFQIDPDILNILLGKRVQGIDNDTMFDVWICAGKIISSMYYKVLKSRTGVG